MKLKLSVKYLITKNTKNPFNWIFLIILTILFLVFLIAFLLFALIKLSPRSKIRNKGAIVTNGIECAKMGREIFEKGGNVADAAVTVVLCEGVTSPQSCGIGGGFLLTIYFRDSQKTFTLNARETAPKLSTFDMFNDNPSLSMKGGLSVAVPSEIKGLWELHKNFGHLKWKDLIKPVIDLCRSGSLVSPYLEDILSTSESKIRDEQTLRNIFINPQTNKTFKRGEKIKRLKLAETLEMIAEKGAGVMYGGEIGRKLVEDVRERGGILSEEDLRDYNVKWSSPISTTFLNNLTLHSMPLPSSSAIINFILNIISSYKLSNDSQTFHRLTEAMKFAYAKRTFLGDDDSPQILEMIENLSQKSYADLIKLKINETHTINRNVSYYGANFTQPDDHGTAHMNILAPNGDAISVTSTINFKLGAFFESEQTGIILNNEMDDFGNPGAVNIYGIPPSPANFVKPGRHPLSSMSPSIVTDVDGNVRLIIGAAGGSKILTGVLNTIVHHLYLNKSITDAIKARRLHHQLVPYELQFETNFNQEILNDLSEKFGHELLENKPDGGFAAVTGISLIDGVVEGSYDPRRGGSVEIF